MVASRFVESGRFHEWDRLVGFFSFFFLFNLFIIFGCVGSLLLHTGFR